MVLGAADLFIFTGIALLGCQLDWAILTCMAGFAAVLTDLSHLCLLPAKTKKRHLPFVKSKEIYDIDLFCTTFYLHCLYKENTYVFEQLVSAVDAFCHEHKLRCSKSCIRVSAIATVFTAGQITYLKDCE